MFWRYFSSKFETVGGNNFMKSFIYNQLISRIGRKSQVAALALAFFAAFSAVTAAAQDGSGIVTFDYEYKSNAEGKMKAERNRGRRARMFWNAPIRRWTVEVDYGADSPNKPLDLGLDEIAGDDENENNNENAGDADSETNARTLVYHYEYKSNAEGKVRVERNRGRSARMFYDRARRRWTVEVKMISGGGRTEETSADDAYDESAAPRVPQTKSRINASSDIGSGNLPNGATVSYFADREMAAAIHKSALDQGDWTKMWYDENRRAWAVAIKIR